MGSGTGRVDFRSFDPPGEQVKIENKCGSLSTAMSRNECKVTVQFRYEGHTTLSSNTLFGNINLVRAAANLGMIVSK